MIFEVFTTQRDLGTLVLRLFFGILLAKHGYPKLTSQGQKTKGWLVSIGLPGVIGTLVGLLEFFGGILLVLGFLTSLVGILLAIQFAGILLNRKKLGKKVLLDYELDLLYLAGAIAFIFLGGGAYSLDQLLRF